MNTHIHIFTRCRNRESEERMSLREWKYEIPSLQQYVLLHRPEQPSITYLSLALSFSMRLKCILNAPAQLESGGYLRCLCVKGFPFCLSLCRKGGFPRLLIGWKFSSHWSDVLGSQLLGVGWRCRVVAGRSFEAVTDSETRRGGKT